MAMKMDEYIKRKTIKELINMDYDDYHDAIDRIPAADVAPVVHGRWDGDNCTVCKLPWNYNMTQNADDWGYFDPMPDYCPNCGAKMDEEKSNGY